MKRIIEQQRRPEPLEVYTDPEEVADELDDAVASLADQGYDEAHRYQVNLTLPPIDEPDELEQIMENRDCFYLLTDATDGDHRRNEMRYPAFTYENLDVVTDYMERIEDAVDDAGYDINFWQVGAVETPYEKDAVPDVAQEIHAQAMARLDTDESISIGWFYRAPMDTTIEFGYRAFPNREFQPAEYDDPEESVDAVLRQITGQREDERNEHDMSEEELAMLYDIEEALLAHDVL